MYYKGHHLLPILLQMAQYTLALPLWCYPGLMLWSKSRKITSCIKAVLNMLEILF
jgi:hypothetical protein